CQLLHWGYRHLELGTKDRFLQNLSYYFDWSVWEIFIGLTTGASLYMVPKELLLNPEESVAFMTRNDITVLHVTPTQYQYYLKAPEKPWTLNYLFIGAEKLTKELVEKSFESVDKDCRVFNMYGPTECTIISAVLEIERSDVDKFENLSSVPIGRAVGNIDLLVLDRYLNLSPVNVWGELYIAGDCVARGYLNNPELTAEKFNRSYRSYKTNIFYKTGDLARRLVDGNVEFLGRLDQQVKIRGFRIELGEIESELLKFGLVKEAVVIDRQGESGEKYLCGYIVEKEKFDLSRLKEYLSKSLPDYMIPSYFMRIGAIPLNPNGKLDRKALPAIDVQIQTGRAFVAPANEIEERLAALWVEILDIEKDKLSMDENFFELGGHSLKATILSAKIHKTFDVKIPLVEIFRLPTIRESAQYIQEMRALAKDNYAAVAPVEKKEYYVLSSMQRRLYILQQMVPLSTVYNMPQVQLLSAVPDKEKLAETFKRLIRRHESLRTSFIAVNEKPVQKIHDEVEFEIEYYDLAANNAKGREEGRGDATLSLWSADIITNFVRPFDLSRVPLLRVGLVKTEEEKYLLMIDMHHIISDGVSQGVLLQEFLAIYDGVSLPSLLLHYKDFAEWQNNPAHQETLKRQERYWSDRLSGELPVLNLPYDYPRPEVQGFEGRQLDFFIGPGETSALKALAAREDATLYMVLLAAFYLLSARLSGQEDIIVGAPVAGRSHADIQQIIGMFVNTLALRNYPAAEKTIGSFLQEVKTNALGAFENQDYPFEDLVEKVTVVRDIGRNPVFDVVFVLQNLAEQGAGAESAAAAPSYRYEGKTAKFDMTLFAVETGENLTFLLEYCTRLFKEDTIGRFINYFKNIVVSIAANSHQRIADVEMLTEEEKLQLMVEFNDTGEPFPKDKTIHQLFEEQVERTPDHITIIGAALTFRPVGPVGPVSLSYRELHDRSRRFAGLLQEKGVKSDSIVALMMERSLEMIIGIFGILKAGGAYLPIDPDYPRDRIDYMLNDSNARILINKSEIRNKSQLPKYK
ncbi:MAG: hypothetical protein QG657_3058, partial [Acidobacteriota bacterium]|nr:hypothetical protein [Acidobacteriota bacterium]